MGRLKFFWVKGKNRPPGPYRINKQYINVNTGEPGRGKGSILRLPGIQPWSDWKNHALQDLYSWADGNS